MTTTPTTTTLPCLWFDTDGLEAAERYVSLVPDSEITEVVRNPDGSALTVSFTLAGREYLVLNGGPAYALSPAFSIQLLCEDQAEVDRCWDALLEGGEESRCGWLQDRWGVSWQVVPRRLLELRADPDPARAQRAVEAMLGMRKLVVAELEAAADAVPA
ncbi:VOC family protein [Kineococcus terrestris]|uniref:VOC family protein n=1 Tax=Kineococcus terrestris TaxID=2044856 RepID=UPI0034DAC5B6